MPMKGWREFARLLAESATGQCYFPAVDGGKLFRFNVVDAPATRMPHQYRS
jgi:hypothetical protein